MIGAYTVNCGSPAVTSCIERGETLTSTFWPLDLQSLATELLDHGGDLVPVLDRTRLVVLVTQRQRFGPYSIGVQALRGPIRC